jgi:hypothetical protein
VGNFEEVHEKVHKEVYSNIKRASRLDFGSIE